jgi:Domain of unknown function (DUF4259)
MGAWGAGSFDNDDAGDWVWELEDTEDTAILDEAFSQVTERGEDYLEASECSVAIAAAEVVAALRGRPAADLPDEVTAYVDRIGTHPSPAQIASALGALERVKTKSELQELWDESDSLQEWRQGLADLEARLR